MVIPNNSSDPSNLPAGDYLGFSRRKRHAPPSAAAPSSGLTYSKKAWLNRPHLFSWFIVRRNAAQKLVARASPARAHRWHRGHQRIDVRLVVLRGRGGGLVGCVRISEGFHNANCRLTSHPTNHLVAGTANMSRKWIETSRASSDRSVRLGVGCEIDPNARNFAASYLQSTVSGSSMRA